MDIGGINKWVEEQSAATAAWGKNVPKKTNVTLGMDTITERGDKGVRVTSASRCGTCDELLRVAETPHPHSWMRP